MTITTRAEAKIWLAKHGISPGPIWHASKFHPGIGSGITGDRWWIEISEQKLMDNLYSVVHLLCRKNSSKADFHHLAVRAKFLLEMKDLLGFREDIGKFSLIISAERNQIFTELRGPGRVPLGRFLVSHRRSSDGRQPELRHEVYTTL